MDFLTETEAAYIAGFIDGEGTFNVLRTAQRFLVEMSVGQIDRRPLDFLMEKMGGTLCQVQPRPGTNKRPLWVYKLASGRRFDFYVPQLLPFLVLKRRKAELGLELRARIRAKPRIRLKARCGEEWDARMAIVQRAAAEQAMWGA